MKFRIITKKILLYIIIFLHSCSFYSFKGSIPSHINSVVISPLKNETSEFIISDLLYDKFLKLLLIENILDIVSFENADSKLDLIIVSLIDKPNIYTISKDDYEIVGLISNFNTKLSDSSTYDKDI